MFTKGNIVSKLKMLLRPLWFRKVKCHYLSHFNVPSEKDNSISFWNAVKVISQWRKWQACPKQIRKVRNFLVKNKDSYAKRHKAMCYGIFLYIYCFWDMLLLFSTFLWRYKTTTLVIPSGWDCVSFLKQSLRFLPSMLLNSIVYRIKSAVPLHVNRCCLYKPWWKPR